MLKATDVISANYQHEKLKISDNLKTYHLRTPACIPTAEKLSDSLRSLAVRIKLRRVMNCSHKQIRATEK